MFKNKFMAFLLIFALSVPCLIVPVEHASANDKLENIWQGATRYSDNHIDMVELSDIEDINFNEIYVVSGQLRIRYADIIGKENVAGSVYFRKGVADAVYGELGIELPRLDISSGNFNLIRNINGKLEAQTTDNILWLPLIADTSKPHHYKTNPLQEMAIAWNTKYGWERLDIVPISTADMALAGRVTTDKLVLSPSMYDAKTDELFADTGKQEGQISLANGIPLKSGSTDLIGQRNEFITLNYADSLATIQDTVYGDYGMIILTPEKEGKIEKVIIKPKNKEAYFSQSRYGGIAIPLLDNEHEPYQAKTNPIYNEIEVAWQLAGEDNWKMAVIKLVSKTDEFFRRAETYTGNLDLHKSLYNPETKILYSDASQKSGELKAKDGTNITRDNVVSQSGGIIRVNYADSLVNVTQTVDGQNTRGHLLLALPENIADGDPRFIIKAGESDPELVTVESDFLAIPLQNHKKDLQDSVIAWRSKDGEWFKVTIRPLREYKKPKVTSLHPRGEIVDEKSFSPETINGKERYFLRVVFADDGGLTYDNLLVSKLPNVSVFAVGGSRQSMLDWDLLEYASKLTEEERKQFIEKYLFRRATGNVSLYIPVRKLLPQAHYNVEVPSGLVRYPEGVGNDLIAWEFGTIGAPHITDISLGSIGEDYDVSEPIYIYGNYFAGENIKVKFNDIEAYRLNVREEDGESYLEVFLPRGRDRLKPGLYNILVIKNDNEVYSQTLHASLSVIKASDFPAPQDGVRVKTESRVGDVVERVNTSSDTLLINSRHDRDYISLNLDELMGPNVLVRKIKFPRNWRGTTGIYTSSKWANVEVHQLRPSTNAYNIDDVELRLGRAEPSLIPTLKRGMINSKIISEFIEVAGENLEFARAQIEIPYSNSDGQYIRVLRYDEAYRQWFEQPFTKDLLNAVVSFSTNQGGIFVIVE